MVHDQFLGRKMISVPACNMNGIAHPAAHNIIVIIPVKQLYIACVKIMDGLILHISRTGIYAMGIQVLVRKKRRLLLFIVNEIPCGIVTPELNLPCGLKGCILIINMVQSLKLAEPIGVVQPAGFRHQVVGQAAFIRPDPFPVIPVVPVPCFIVLPADLLIFLQTASSSPLLSSGCFLLTTAVFRLLSLYPRSMFMPS